MQSRITVGARGCTWTIRSVHSVGVGADLSRPSTPNCINTTRITMGVRG
ncbi:MAG: hypothetical protein HXN81_10640 [Prevotella pallens]|nr:hypothetical protein [Prevotella pallens]MBF1499212.1 hypothetical protein [Prevotella pallens]